MPLFLLRPICHLRGFHKDTATPAALPLGHYKYSCSLCGCKKLSPALLPAGEWPSYDAFEDRWF